jgi:hypothetical protein
MMRPRSGRLDYLLLLMAAPALVCLLQGCSAGDPASSHSSSADRFIAEAADDEERRGLTQARDDIDAQMRDLVAGKDAEIEKLRKENEALQARLKK